MKFRSTLGTVAVCLLALLGASAAEPDDDSIPSLRVLSMTPRGERTEVVLELVVVSATSPRTQRATVTPWNADTRRTPPLAVSAGRGLRGRPWAPRFRLELESGRTHDLRVTIDDGDGEPQVVHHRVDLDTRRAPRRRLGAIEHRIPGADAR